MEINRQRYLSKQITQFTLDRKANSIIYLLSLLIVISTIVQVWIIADLISSAVVNNNFPGWIYLLILIAFFILKAILIYWREQVAFQLGKTLRTKLRKLIIQRCNQLGEQGTNQSPANLANFYMEQVEHLHHFVARFKPQLKIAILQPLIILLAVFYYNWLAGLILLITIPVLPLFMYFIGVKTAQVSQRQVGSLLHLGSQFYDKLKGIDTVISFNIQQKSLYELGADNEEYREVTMKLLRIAFLNGAVLEFFTSLAIALMAVYFGFEFMGSYSIGNYNGMTTSLFIGFFCLTLASEYYQPMRDLGSFYHDKSNAISAMDLIDNFLHSPPEIKEEYIYKPLNDNLEIRHTSEELERQEYLAKLALQRQQFLATSEIKIPLQGTQILSSNSWDYCLQNLIVVHPSGVKLAGPFNLQFNSQQNTALIGISGGGKSSLLNCLMGQYPYLGSIKINGIEFSQLNYHDYISQISWLGQNPNLDYTSILENMVMSYPQLTQDQLQIVNNLLKNKQATTDDQQLQQIAGKISDLVNLLDVKFIYQRNLLAPIQEQKSTISIGQLQRIALIRALIKPHKLLFLDEPTASLDQPHQQLIFDYLQHRKQHGVGVVMITHHQQQITNFDNKFTINRLTARQE